MKHVTRHRSMFSINREDGTVLMVVAILGVVLLVFAGLAIDTTINATSQSQMRYRAEFAALGALRKYHEEPGDYAAKLEAARLRAEEMAGLNLSIAMAFEENPGQGQEIGTSASSSPSAETGVIIPGIWHRQPPSDCAGQPSPCPCDGGVWKGACFQEIDLDDPLQQSLTVTAFRADVYTRSSSPIRRIFGGLAGAATLQLSASATASVVPYHGMLLLDISRNSQFETHVPFEQNGGLAKMIYQPSSSESAWKLDGTSCLANNGNPCGTVGVCTFDGGGEPPGMQNAIYNFNTLGPALRIIPDTRSSILAPQRYITKHAKDDYQCFETTYTEDGGPSRTERYLVDTFRGATVDGHYDGPEPLTTLFHGINSIYRHLNSYPSRGDKIGLLAFDRSAKIDIRTFQLEAPGNVGFQSAMLITDILNEDATSRKKRFEEHMFFPRVEGYTNYPQALKVALDMLLAEPDAESAENFVVLMSDGLTNCTENGICAYDEPTYLASVSEAMNIILNDYVSNQVKFHMVVSGKITQPHTMLASSHKDPTQCMTEEEARLFNPPLDFVDTTTTDTFAEATRGSGFYYHPLTFYQAVRATDGLWLPLRPCCQSGGVCADVRSDLQTVCASTAPGVNGNLPAAATHPSYTDANGRLACDPEGRSRRTQFDDYVNEIFERNPYVLVE
ncbi:MAG: VWA domain-containing protein [Bdellovibrionales bacterium]|nr:VWA domain-containing protein [Bdellovibrionales bacterium]